MLKIRNKVMFLGFFIIQFGKIQKIACFTTGIIEPQKSLENQTKTATSRGGELLARAVGLEPTTYGLTVRCSTD